MITGIILSRGPGPEIDDIPDSSGKFSITTTIPPTQYFPSSFEMWWGLIDTLQSLIEFQYTVEAYTPTNVWRWCATPAAGLSHSCATTAIMSGLLEDIWKDLN